MVQLTTMVFALAAAVSSASAAGTCVEGQRYCGYTLQDRRGYSRENDIIPAATAGNGGVQPSERVIYHALYTCGANNAISVNLSGPGDQPDFCTRDCLPPNPSNPRECPGPDDCCRA